MEDQQRALAELYIENNTYYGGGGGGPVPVNIVLPPIQPLRKMDLGAPIHVHPQYYSVMHTHSAFTPPHMLHMQPHVYAAVSRERTSNARGHDEDPIGGDGNAEMQHYLHTSFHPYGLPLQDPNGPMMLTEEQAMEVDAARALEELAGAGRMQQQQQHLQQQRCDNTDMANTRAIESPMDVVGAHYAAATKGERSPSVVIVPPFPPQPTPNGTSDLHGDSSADDGGEEVESRTTGGLDNPFPASCSRPPSASTSYYRTAEERAAATPRAQRPRKSRTGVPVPVPHLTKPSRGRRVPKAEATTSSLSTSDVVVHGAASPVSPRSGTTSPYGTRGAAKSPPAPSRSPVNAAEVEAKIASSSRAYVCQVEGCGKAFRRGEHLKRHVRSLHTHDKPERCTHPGCGKEFSRKDNMQQHLKIHTHNRVSSSKDGDTSEEPEAIGEDDDDDETPPEDESHSS